MTPERQALAELVAATDEVSHLGEGTVGGRSEEELAANLLALVEYERPIRQRLEDAWAAARAVLAQGEGWVMVPKEPTEVMRLAGNASYWASQLANRGEYRYEDDDAGVVYRAMIAAAPKVPT